MPIPNTVQNSLEGGHALPCSATSILGTTIAHAVLQKPSSSGLGPIRELPTRVLRFSGLPVNAVDDELCAIHRACLILGVLAGLDTFTSSPHITHWLDLGTTSRAAIVLCRLQLWTSSSM